MWFALALGAGLFQSVRNGLARSLSNEITPILNSWSRFAFNLPFSASLFLAVTALRGLADVDPAYLGLCLASGVAQLLANIALIAAFRKASFAQSIVLHKLEVVGTAVIGALAFAELPSPTGWLGIAASAAGVIGIHLGRVTDRSKVFRFDVGSILGLTAGLLLAVTSFLIKEANEVLVTLNPRVGEGRFEIAVHTLFHVTWMEVVLLSGYLRLRRPGELRLVSRHWRRMLLIGLSGFLGSLGWFWAFSLTLVAYVKAVGQVESVVAVFLSLLVWKEREVFRQLPGMLLVLAGILLVLLGR